MKPTIKFVKIPGSIMRVAILIPFDHNVPDYGWTLQLYTGGRNGGWYLYEEDDSGNQTGEAVHFARHAEAVKYARSLYDNGKHLTRNYLDEWQNFAAEFTVPSITTQIVESS